MASAKNLVSKVCGKSWSQDALQLDVSLKKSTSWSNSQKHLEILNTFRKICIESLVEVQKVVKTSVTIRITSEMKHLFEHLWQVLLSAVCRDKDFGNQATEPGQPTSVEIYGSGIVRTSGVYSTCIYIITSSKKNTKPKCNRTRKTCAQWISSWNIMQRICSQLEYFCQQGVDSFNQTFLQFCLLHLFTSILSNYPCFKSKSKS